MAFSRIRRIAINRAEIAKRSKAFGPVCKGVTAYRLGLTPMESPFVLNTPDWHAWMVGWLAQYDKEHPHDTA